MARAVQALRKIDFKDLELAFLSSLLFLFVSVSLPVYDNVNGFHNIFSDNYKLIWYDGRSPLNFEIIKRIVEERPLYFNEEELIEGLPVQNYFDLLKVGNFYYPIFNLFPTYLYGILLFMTPSIKTLEVHKALFAINMIISSISLFVFYFLQRKLGLSRTYAFFSSITAGIATSLLIYSRYLFLKENLALLFFLLFSYVTIFKDLKKDFYLFTSLLFFSIFIFIFSPTAILFVFFSIPMFGLLWKENRIGKTKVLITYFVVMFTLIFLYNSFLVSVRPSTVEKFSISKSIFHIFPQFINSVDYSVYGFHNVSSLYPSERQYAYIYGFEQPKGNAIFIFSSGFFNSLFGPRGILFNSPFLLFSILGIIYFVPIQRRYLLLSLILFISILGIFNLYYNDLTPRYARGFEVPIFFLTFFSFYFIQKTKNWSVKFLFFIFIFLSILNVFSLSVRADWVYENEFDLVSKDLVVWPYLDFGQHEFIPEMILTEKSEQRFWFSESECGVSKERQGIVTDICNCGKISKTYRQINIPWENIKISFVACSRGSGNDGTNAIIQFDDYRSEFYISPRSCISKEIFLNTTEGNHVIHLTVSQYGNCDEEMVDWKLIRIERS